MRTLFIMVGPMVAVLLGACGDEPVENEKPENCPEVLYVGNGAEPASFHAGERLLGIDTIYAAYANNEKFIFLDARPPLDFNLHTVVNAMPLPYYEVENCVDYLPKDAWYITFCACPHNESEYAADVLEEAGFTKVKVLDEGYIEWRNRGYPTTDNPNGTPDVQNETEEQDEGAAAD